MSNESQVLRVLSGAATGKRATAEVSLVNAAGAVLPAVNLPTLPTSNGNYVLTVTDGVYTWSAETP